MLLSFPFFFLAKLHGLRALSSATRALADESTESQPRGHSGSPLPSTAMTFVSFVRFLGV